MVMRYPWSCSGMKPVCARQKLQPGNSNQRNVDHEHNATPRTSRRVRFPYPFDNLSKPLLNQPKPV